MPVITDSKRLKELVAGLKGAKYVAIDTEFDRRSTYYPTLCLVQIAGPNYAFAVDTLAEGLNFKPLLKLLKDRKIIKVFHSAREDIETIYRFAKIIPKPFFDTQVAASFLGFGESVSYASLLETLTGEVLDKSQRYSNWLQRPLTAKQVSYAMADVVPLRKLYEALESQLKEVGKARAAKEIMLKLLKPSRYKANPKKAWERLVSRRMGARQIKYLKKVARWREAKAQEINIPRQWVISDALLKKISYLGKDFRKALDEDRELQYVIKETRVNKAFLKEIISLIGR